MIEKEQRGDDGQATASISRVDMEAAKRTHVRMTLVQQFHVESAFIGVPKLATILGLSPSTVWGYMREGKFFIPYRMFNKSPMVCIDDLVEWYCAPDGVSLGCASQLHEPPLVHARTLDAKSARAKETDEAVAHALASIGIDPKSKRGSLRRM